MKYNSFQVGKKIVPLFWYVECDRVALPADAALAFIVTVVDVVDTTLAPKRDYLASL